MPWVNEDLCSGCGICVEECPVDAIKQVDGGSAEICEAECVRCGRCHDVCPEEAVRHDGEKIPEEAAENLRWVRGLLAHCEQPDERAAFMQRIARFFSKEKKVDEQTIAAIAAACDEPIAGLDAAIRTLSRGGGSGSCKEP
jgi:ferredoxin